MILKSYKPVYSHYFTLIRYFSIAVIFLSLFSITYLGLWSDASIFLWALGLYLAIALLAMLYIKIVNDDITYSATHEGVEKREGVIMKQSSVVPYEKISDFATKQGLLERLFGMGTLYIYATGGGSDYKITMRRMKLKDLNELLGIITDMLEPGEAKSNAEETSPPAPPAQPPAAAPSQRQDEVPAPRPPFAPAAPTAKPPSHIYEVGDVGKEKLQELEYMAYVRQAGQEGAEEPKPEQPCAPAKKKTPPAPRKRK
ncbi:Bacterial PH domain protein [Candidatus Burarchaeum australiense]|nr:Bacterial PH domain protein [Candidatus Burarchaeum australiense]